MIRPRAHTGLAFWTRLDVCAGLRSVSTGRRCHAAVTPSSALASTGDPAGLAPDHQLGHKGGRNVPYRPDPRWPGWKPTVGLELHVQLKGNPKLFSRESLGLGPSLSCLRVRSVLGIDQRSAAENAVYYDPPNSHVAPFDAALPGALPVSIRCRARRANRG